MNGMNFAFGFMVGQLMRWMFSKLLPLWWIGAAALGGSVVGQLLARAGVPQSIVIPVSWVTVGFLLVYLRKWIKAKRAVPKPSSLWDNRG